jgi:predicted MFS family arabinose efflux permease
LLINAIFFHIAPVFMTRGRFSPGLITAILLFLPIGVASYWKAAEGGLLDGWTLMSSLLLGAVLMAMPIVLLNLKGRPYFRQDRD